MSEHIISLKGSIYGRKETLIDFKAYYFRLRKIHYTDFRRLIYNNVCRNYGFFICKVENKTPFYFQNAKHLNLY